MKKPNKHPQSVAEAVSALLALIKPEDKEQIRRMNQKDLMELHFTLGMYIRNNFGFWQGNRRLLADCGNANADDASGVIIEALWRTLQKQAGPALPAQRRRLPRSK